MRILIIKSRSALSVKAKTSLKAEVEEAKQTSLLVLTVTQRDNKCR
ncbi:hypothetical protein [Bacillus safensis]